LPPYSTEVFKGTEGKLEMSYSVTQSSCLSETIGFLQESHFWLQMCEGDGTHISYTLRY